MSQRRCCLIPNVYAVVVMISSIFIPTINGQYSSSFISLKNAFSNCSWGANDFDNCVKEGINAVRPLFKIGIPELNITPFDPFYAKEVIQARGSTTMSYTLKLKEVYERGWTESIVTKFKSNPKKGLIQYGQYFPEKYLHGEYEFEGNLMSTNLTNSGKWNLTLYDYIQTTTMSKPSKADKIKVRIEVQQIGNMALHIGNLLQGRALMENVLDRVINTAWRPGFAVVKPLVNDLVSTAFTKIFNDVFNDLNLATVIPD